MDVASPPAAEPMSTESWHWVAAEPASKPTMVASEQTVALWATWAPTKVLRSPSMKPAPAE